MSALNVHEVLRRPVISEKNTLQGEIGKYTFEVHPTANKTMIKEAVEAIFSVSVTAVNTSHVRGKMKRVGRFRGMTPGWKKAVVTVLSGQRIDFLEGV